jgi:hypothetical protein
LARFWLGFLPVWLGFFSFWIRFSFFGFRLIKPKPNRTGRFFQDFNRFFFMVWFFQLFFFNFLSFLIFLLTSSLSLVCIETLPSLTNSAYAISFPSKHPLIYNLNVLVNSIAFFIVL